MSTPTARSWRSKLARRSALVVAVAALLLLAVALDARRRARARPRADGARPIAQITWENYHKIKHGMTRAEVEAILHGPEGDHTDGVRDYYDLVYTCEGYCSGPVCQLFERSYLLRRGDWGAVEEMPEKEAIPDDNELDLRDGRPRFPWHRRPPPEKEPRPEDIAPLPPEQVHPSSPGGQIAVWWGLDYAIAAEFDALGKVCATGIGRYSAATEKPEPPESEADLLDRLAELLGL